MYSISPLGVSFDTSLQDLITQIPVAMKVFSHGVEAFTKDPANEELRPRLSCDGNETDSDSESRWQLGEKFHTYASAVYFFFFISLV